MAKLSVNVNKVATLRNTRHSGIPSVVRAARIALEAGGHGITVHPRPDERHIRPADVYEIAELLRSFPEAEYNIEGNPHEAYLAYARAVRPTQCTLVPDTPEAFTSDHGWDLKKDADRLIPIIETLHSYGCRVSLFLEAVPESVDLAPRTGADRIELYTGPYAEAFARGDPAAVQPYAETARRAADRGLGVNAGHDLNLDNLPRFLSSVPQVAEVSIGHALIADALERGLAGAVREYLRVVAR
jgi:pyridoxine 5-phosphate synthase